MIPDGHAACVTCLATFPQPDRLKHKWFCSITCKRDFERAARRIGAALLMRFPGRARVLERELAGEPVLARPTPHRA